MDCKNCGSPIYHPSPSKLCPKCEGEKLDKYIAQQEAAQQGFAPDVAGVAARCVHGYNGSCPECGAVQTPPRR